MERNQKIKQDYVKERYAKVATGKTCCDGSDYNPANPISLVKAIGYSDQELENLPPLLITEFRTPLNTLEP